MTIFKGQYQRQKNLLLSLLKTEQLYNIVVSSIYTNEIIIVIDYVNGVPKIDIIYHSDDLLFNYNTLFYCVLLLLIIYLLFFFTFIIYIIKRYIDMDILSDIGLKAHGTSINLLYDDINIFIIIYIFAYR